MAKDKQSAEAEIFALTKKIDLHLRAGDTDEVARLQRQISELHQKYGAVQGRGEDANAGFGY